MSFLDRLYGNCCLLSNGNLPGLPAVDRCPGDPQDASKPSLRETELAPDCLVLLRGHLSPHDRFNLVTFASSILKTFSPLNRHPVSGCRCANLQRIKKLKTQRILKVISNTWFMVLACCNIPAIAIKVGEVLRLQAQISCSGDAAINSFRITTNSMSRGIVKHFAFQKLKFSNLTHLLPNLCRFFATFIKRGSIRGGIFFIHSNKMLHTQGGCASA